MSLIWFAAPEGAPTLTRSAGIPCESQQTLTVNPPSPYTNSAPQSVDHAIPDDWTLRYDREALIPEGHLATPARSVVVPIAWEGSTPISVGYSLPSAWSAFRTLTRAYVIPAEWDGVKPLTRSFVIPAAWGTSYARRAALPYENSGGGPDDLSVSWNVLSLLDQPLLAVWLVFSTSRVFLLPVMWNVIELPATLPVRWRVTGNLDALFGTTAQDSGNPGEVR